MTQIRSILSSMKLPESRPLSGRQAQARRNDPRIREAAREVFTADPDAPMSAVAARAGVGISALYRRYASKEDLLREVARDGLARYLEEAEARRRGRARPVGGLRRVHGPAPRCADRGDHDEPRRDVRPGQGLYEMSMRAAELNERIVERTKAAGELRSDIVVDDLSLILESVSSIRLGTERRTRELRQRYLALFLDGLRTSATNSLPGPPPAPTELAQRWMPRART